MSQFNLEIALKLASSIKSPLFDVWGKKGVLYVPQKYYQKANHMNPNSEFHFEHCILLDMYTVSLEFKRSAILTSNKIIFDSLYDESKEFFFEISEIKFYRTTFFRRKLITE